ncbi:hypothetical protein Tco_0863589, partial [Tanacetum coccineum]
MHHSTPSTDTPQELRPFKNSCKRQLTIQLTWNLMETWELLMLVAAFDDEFLSHANRAAAVVADGGKQRDGLSNVRCHWNMSRMNNARCYR